LSNLKQEFCLQQKKNLKNKWESEQMALHFYSYISILTYTRIHNNNYNNNQYMFIRIIKFALTWTTSLHPPWRRTRKTKTKLKKSLTALKHSLFSIFNLNKLQQRSPACRTFSLKKIIQISGESSSEDWRTL